jgi:hypothetical protein
MSLWKNPAQLGIVRAPLGISRIQAGLAALTCLWLLAMAAIAPGRAASDASVRAHAAGPVSAHAAGSVRAHAAGVLTVNDTGRLRFVGESGGDLAEEGPASGTLPGSVRARLTLGTNVTLGFTIYLHNGTISGSGAAKLNPGKGAYASFNGSLRVSHGSGHYAHASGSGGLYGTINRENDNATVQVVGRLHI